MKILSRIWNDIKRGENIDLFLTIIAAFGLVALNLAGLATATLIAPLTLAVLGLLAISTLGNRYRSEELFQKLAQSAESIFLDEFPQSLESDFEKATELWLVGVTFSRTVKTYYSTIEQKLQKGHTVKVLLVHPEGTAVKMAEERAYRPTNIERKRMEILGTLEDLCELRNHTNGKLEIRTIDNPLSFGARAMSPESASGILYIEHYPYKVAGGAKPKFVLKASDGRWYNLFIEEMRLLWENSIQWECSKSSHKAQ